MYFADSSSKSANYVFASASNNIGFMLLCEVALGKMNELTHAEYMDKPPKVTPPRTPINIESMFAPTTSPSVTDRYSRRCAGFVLSTVQGCLSTKGLGQSVPDDDEYTELEDGLVVPIGKLKRDNSGGQRSLLYNEYDAHRTYPLSHLTASTSSAASLITAFCDACLLCAFCVQVHRLHDRANSSAVLVEGAVQLQARWFVVRLNNHAR